MAFNRFGTFTLGVIIAAVSVGAVSFANAAGNTTLKACANKKSGTMRYISKGSCKKTEKSLSWSQMGPTGTNGQNYFAVDATGKTVGAVTGTSWGAYDVLIEGKIWNLASELVGYLNSSLGDASSAYSNSSCTTPYFKLDSEAPLRTWTTTNNIQGVAIDSGNPYESVRTNSTYKAYQPSGAALSWTTSTVYFWDMLYDEATRLATGVCNVRSDADKVTDAKNYTLYAAVEVVRPTYTAPLTLVAR